MSNVKRDETEVIAVNGETVRLIYEHNEDILEVFFGQNEPATGVELTDHILLRVSQHTGKALSLTLLHFSILAERTEYGPRSYPLNSFDDLSEDLQEAVAHIIITPPVNQFLKVSHFQASPTERVPFTYVDPCHVASVA